MSCSGVTDSFALAASSRSCKSVPHAAPLGLLKLQLQLAGFGGALQGFAGCLKGASQTFEVFA